MFSLFVVLLSCIESLGKKCLLFLNDEPCMFRPTLTDINPVELKYYPFVISLNKCTGSCLIFKNMCSKRNKIHIC